ncbi:MAG: APC family permease [Caulobacteraceae bacterium]|nr:APC family permease [Caulobacteraceae bacterium]
MAEPPPAADGALRGSIGAVQYFTLGFGTIIGSAWVVLLGDWLTEAGPGGAILGFAAGGLVMMVIGYCYAELVGRIPEAGSEFIYAYRVFGPAVGFIVGWFLLLYLVGVTVYEALALPWVLEVLIPPLKGADLYASFGSPITTDALAVSLAIGLGVIGLNLMGVKTAVRVHSLLTFGFLTIALLALSAMLASGKPANAMPLLASANGRPWWLGAGSLFAFCAYGLNGFQAIPQTIEERSHRIGLATISKILVISIGAAALFYGFVILAVSLAAPWTTSIRSPLAAAAAARSIPFGRYVAAALLCATAASLLKAWNGIFMMAVRLLLAMARVGLFPGALARLDPRFQSPRLAVLAIGGLNLAGVFLGRGAVEPITDMCAMVLTLTYVMCCCTVLLLRRRERAGGAAPRSDLLVWLGLVGAAVMALAAFVSPFWRGEAGLPLEWRLVIVWSIAGAGFWFAFPGRRSAPTPAAPLPPVA